jgi:hypothetical protein
MNRVSILECMVSFEHEGTQYSVCDGVDAHGDRVQVIDYKSDNDAEWATIACWDCGEIDSYQDYADSIEYDYKWYPEGETWKK